MLLRINILTRDVEILIIVVADVEVLRHLVGYLFATEYSTGALTNADGVACTIDIVSKDLAALGEELVVGGEAGTDIDDIDVFYYLLGARDGLEVLAFGNDGPLDATVVIVGDSTHEGVARHDGNAETAHTVGLHGEAALTGHGLDDGLDGGTSLHALIRGQVADVTSTHGEDFLT